MNKNEEPQRTQTASPHRIMVDSRIRGVAWRDLVPLSKREITVELLLSLPWLLLSWGFAAYGWYLPALGCSFFFFLTGIRQVHDAFHNALRLPRWAVNLQMLIQGIVMLGSMHAVRFN